MRPAVKERSELRLMNCNPLERDTKNPVFAIGIKQMPRSDSSQKLVFMMMSSTIFYDDHCKVKGSHVEKNLHPADPDHSRAEPRGVIFHHSTSSAFCFAGV
jgi:hypothetical protein